MPGITREVLLRTFPNTRIFSGFPFLQNQISKTCARFISNPDQSARIPLKKIYSAKPISIQDPTLPGQRDSQDR